MLYFTVLIYFPFCCGHGSWRPDLTSLTSSSLTMRMFFMLNQAHVSLPTIIEIDRMHRIDWIHWSISIRSMVMDNGELSWWGCSCGVVFGQDGFVNTHQRWQDVDQSSGLDVLMAFERWMMSGVGAKIKRHNHVLITLLAFMWQRSSRNMSHVDLNWYNRYTNSTSYN